MTLFLTLIGGLMCIVNVIAAIMSTKKKHENIHFVLSCIGLLLAWGSALFECFRRYYYG